jgi:MoaA/NifB/PqqE/SkfB family radical SAM enzyme
MLDKVFCIVPWVEVHINADGTYHTCGAQPNKMSYSNDRLKYNVLSMSVPDWTNSEYQCKTRLKKINGESEELCNLCYHEDDLYNNSKRIRENLKIKINHNNFEHSFRESKYYEDFIKSKIDGKTNIIRPTSYHISLGNECNLTCKMCGPTYSSSIAAQETRLGNYKGPIKMNWTNDQFAWDSVTDYICETENLEFVHIIGGEPLLNPKFENLIDKLIASGRTNIYFGFTTNGTMFNKNILEKLNVFRQVDIGISIECMGELNQLIRNGSNTQHVLDNVDLYLKYRSPNHVYVTIRTVPSALSVHNLDDLFKWCVDRKLDIMSNILSAPVHLCIRHLPEDVKSRLLEQYSKWEYSEPAPVYSNPRDPSWFKQHIDNEIRAIIKSLNLPGNPEITKELYNKLSSWQWLNKPNIAKYFETTFKA